MVRWVFDLLRFDFGKSGNRVEIVVFGKGYGDGIKSFGEGVYGVLFEIGGFDSFVFNGQRVCNFGGIIIIDNVVVMDKVFYDVKGIVEGVFGFIDNLWECQLKFGFW